MNITLDDIRSKAPEGATHYRYKMLSDGFVFYKHSNGEKLKYWIGGEWRYTENSINNHTIKPINGDNSA